MSSAADSPAWKTAFLLNHIAAVSYSALPSDDRGFVSTEYTDRAVVDHANRPMRSGVLAH